MNVILRAAAVARDAHEGQRRKYNGDPYIRHPGRVAARASVLPYADEDLVAAAWLHDTVEDTDLTIEQITEQFGDRVAVLVDGLTNQFEKAQYPDLNRKERKRREMQRLAEASKEVRVLKMLDRIDNLREMVDAEEGFKRVYLEESESLLAAIGSADLDLADELKATIEEVRTGLLV